MPRAQPVPELTQAQVGALAWEGKRRTIRCGGVPGLVVRVHQTGATFALQRELKGKTCLLTLGCTTKHTLAAARRWARSQQVLFDQGIDPTAPPPPPAEVPTLGRAWAARTEWLKLHRRPATVANHVHFERYFSDWLATPLTGITREMLVARHAALGGRPVLANRCMKHFRETYHYASDLMLPLPPCPLPKGHLFYPERPKRKALNVPELSAWAEKVERHPRRAMLHFMLYSGLRRATTLALRWDWIGWQCIEIPGEAMKGRQDYTMPLSWQMKAILDRLPRTDERIFPYAGTRIKVAAHGHILRHTYRTHAMAAGVPEAFIDLLMNHKRRGIGDAYTSPDALFEEMRKWQQVISDRLENFL